MKICLINTTLPHSAVGLWPPLGLGYIAASLEQEGHKITIIDRESLYFRKDQNWDKVNNATESLLREFKPDIIGTTAFTPQIYDAYYVSSLAKSIYPDAPVIIGGPHVSAVPEETLLECKDIDLVCIGEGEKTLVDFASGTNFDNIDGIAFRRSDKIIFTKSRQPIKNIDEIAPPARHLLDMELYTRPSYQVIRGVYSKATSIITSRGCTHKCSYCAGGIVFNNRLRFHSPEYVVNEILELIEKYHIDGLYFADDQFLAHKKRAVEICNLMIEEGINEKIRWAAQIRVDAANKELLQTMKKAGCMQVEYGFESGSQKILDKMNKKVTAKMNVDAAKLTKKVGIRCLGNMILGMPEETKEDVELSKKFLNQIKLDFASINKLVPLPGTPLWKTLNEKGGLKHEWRTFDTLNLDQNFTEIPKDEFNKLFLDLRKEYDRIDELSNIKSYLECNEFSLTRNYVDMFLRYLVFTMRADGLYHQFKRTLSKINSRFVYRPVVIVNSPYSIYYDTKIKMITWMSADSHGDKLVDHLYYKRLNESGWHLIANDVHSPYEWNTSNLPDGNDYQVLIASYNSITHADGVSKGYFSIGNIKKPYISNTIIDINSYNLNNRVQFSCSNTGEPLVNMDGVDFYTEPLLLDLLLGLKEKDLFIRIIGKHDIEEKSFKGALPILLSFMGEIGFIENQK